MSAPLYVTPPAPVGQQGPPARAAAFDSERSLRAAHGPLLLTTGTAYAAIGKKQKTLKL